MTKEEFIKETSKRGLLLDEDKLRKLEKVNLTAITGYEEVLDKHFYDSLLGFFDLEMKGTLADIGTGAGFPGVVLKICYPELWVTLVEPIKKRCVFLKELIERLDLKDIEIINERGEDLSIGERETFDYVTARAVSDLSILIEVCGGYISFFIV